MWTYYHHIISAYCTELRNAFVVACECFARFRNAIVNKMFKVVDRIGILLYGRIRGFFIFFYVLAEVS